MLRALRTLRDEGLLEFRRGRGIRITGAAERGVVVAHARDLVNSPDGVDTNEPS